MTTQQPAAKQDYKQVLATRAREVFETIDETVNGALRSHPDLADYIRDVLRETALESWRNGIEAGMKRAQQPRPAQRPAARPAHR